MGKILFLSRRNTRNIGDLMCTPLGYEGFGFAEKKHDIYDILDPHVVVREGEVLILGGGGLFQRGTFSKSISILGRVKHSIVWGAGHNSKFRQVSTDSYVSQLKGFDLVGIRDYQASHTLGVDWVPCVSAMNPIFSAESDVKICREIGIIEHEHIKLMSRVYDGFEKLENSNSFQEVIKFIQSSECIVTNSYHGMYWSLLLNKKVGIIPNSSKFFDFIHLPEILVDSYSDLNRLTNLKRPVFDILGACVEANVNFSVKVNDYLNDRF